MKHKIIISMCCALMLLSLTGCQLAQENAGINEYEDRLVGILVTTEYLDLFDFENYLNDNLNNFRGSNIIVDGNTQKYQERLYATLITRTLTNEETGEKSEMEEYVFESIEGISYFAPTVPATAERESYTSSISDEAISEGHMSINYGDDKNSTSLEGTIYTSPSNKDHTYYFNPVYQSSDGSVYVLPERGGFMVNLESYSEGSVYSQTLDNTTTITENGKVKTDSISVKLSISVMFSPEKIIILQMDAESKLLSGTEYAPDTLPQTINMETSTDYLIVETHKRNGNGSKIVTREIYSRDVENISTFFVRADGICVKRWTQIEWSMLEKSSP